LKISIAVPTMWKIRMTLASEGFSSLSASMASWMATAETNRKS
jgi:hypothetical protein